jgi:uncharacterized protein (TIGR02246 family)
LAVDRTVLPSFQELVMQRSTVLACALAVAPLAHAPPTRAQVENGVRPASAPADALGGVAALMNQVQQARRAGDAAFFEKTLAPDYVGVHGDGATETKTQLVAAVRSGALRYTRYDMHDLKVRAYGDAAVANTRVGVQATEANGKPSAGEFVTTWVWVRRLGEWECVAFQATRVVP